jgi:signal peptidase
MPIRLTTALIVVLLSFTIHTSSASILSENYLNLNGTMIHQLIVSIESGSMSPNLNVSDLVVVEEASRNMIITAEEAGKTGYSAFNLPGDIIFYRPYGKENLNFVDQAKMLLGISPGHDKATPIIHRALRFVEKGDRMWAGGPEAPFSGYITKGDHNDVIDQMAGQMFGMANASYIESHRDEIINVGSDIFLDKKTGLLIYTTSNGTYVGEGISYLVPVKKEWIIGIVRARIPNGTDWAAISLNQTNPIESSG